MRSKSAPILKAARRALLLIGIWLLGVPSSLAQSTPAFRETGTASFYGAELAGRRTASGERYDPEAMTAAHPTLPLGAEVTVVAVATGRQVDGRDQRSWTIHRRTRYRFVAARCGKARDSSRKAWRR